MGFWQDVGDVAKRMTKPPSGGEEDAAVTERNYDPDLSAMSIKVAKSQQRMAEDQYKTYLEFFLPYEKEAAAANRELLPLITEASKTTLSLQPEATKAFYEEATKDIDIEERLGEAQADVMHGARLGEGMRRREVSRLGIDPSSSTFANTANLAALDTAKNIGGARRSVRKEASDERFQKLGFALNRGTYQSQVNPNADPYARASASYGGAASTYAPLAQRVLSTTTTGSSGASDGASRAGGTIGGLIGGGVGAYYGGYKGAAAGYGIGSGVGSGIGSLFN